MRRYVSKVLLYQNIHMMRYAIDQDIFKAILFLHISDINTYFIFIVSQHDNFHNFCTWFFLCGLYFCWAFYFIIQCCYGVWIDLHEYEKDEWKPAKIPKTDNLWSRNFVWPFLLSPRRQYKVFMIHILFDTISYGKQSPARFKWHKWVFLRRNEWKCTI